MKRLCFYLMILILLILVWWFGVFQTFNVLIQERYNVTLLSIPNELYTLQTASMALIWGLIGATFTALFGIAGLLSDWCFETSTVHHDKTFKFKIHPKE